MLLRPRLVDPEEFVTLCTVVGSQTRRSDVAVVAEACALHEPLLRDEEQIDLFVEVPDRDDGRDLVVTVAALLYCGKVLQPEWGDREATRFVLLVNVLQACASWLCMIILYVLFREEVFLFVRRRSTAPSPRTPPHGRAGDAARP